MTRRRGSMLIVTLWLVAVLALLSVAISHRMSMELRLVKLRIGQAQAQAAGRGAIRYATELLVAERAEEGFDWLGDEWAAPAPVTNQRPDESGAAPGRDADDAADAPLAGILLDIPDAAGPGQPRRVRLRITDEERRMNLNTAEPSQLARLGASDTFVQALVDYRDVDDPDDPAEDRPDLPVPYIAKDGPLATLAELWLLPVAQEDRDSLERLTADGTVYTDGQINANTASLAVLLAVKGGAAPDQILTAMVTQRAGADGQFGTLDDCVLRDTPEALQDLATCLGKGFEEVNAAVSGLSVVSSVFHITAEPLDGQGRPLERIDAIVNRAQAPPTVLAWQQQ